MAAPQAGSILRQLRRMATSPSAAAPTDGQLLRAFLSRRDESAFETLVRRHGPMVRGVCRRILRNSHDADDAFQAAFLVLVRKAPALAVREVVGDYLHGVAYRTALKARAAAARRRARERQAFRCEAVEEKDRPDWMNLLDQEVGRLPEKYRLPVVYCDLEGRTRKEAARQLGWPEGTLSGRLARARAMLGRRLRRRGVVLSAAALAAGVVPEAAAQVPLTLVDLTRKAATAFAAGQTAAVSSEVVALTEGVVKAMFMDKLKRLSLVLASALILALGVGVWRHAATASPREQSPEVKPAPAPRDLPAEEAEAPAVPKPGRRYQINLRIARGEGEQRKVTEPRILVEEGKAASFAWGKEYPMRVGGGAIESMVMGPQIRAVVHAEGADQVRLDLTVTHPTVGMFSEDEVKVEMESVRVIRKVSLGQTVSAKLETGSRHSTPIEVTATVQEVSEEPREKTIADAERDRKMAEFYQKTGHPDSACFYYELICRRYPNTIYAERARERLAELQKQKEKRVVVEEKEPVRVGAIFIVGNVKTKPEVILKQVCLYPGQILTYPDIQIAERNLARLPQFKSPPRIRVIESEDDGVYRNIVYRNIRIEVEEK